MLVQETIVAVASPPGRSPRALVRASGSGVRAAAAAVLGVVPTRRGVTRARARLSVLGGSCDCPVLALWMEDGASFTGEDALELSCVGAPAIAAAVATALVEGARAAGFDARFARGGEFALRAHLAGRISIDDAESMAARIAATSDAEIAAADELAHGNTGLRAALLLQETAELLAIVEAGIDFTDQEDVVAITPEQLATRSSRLQKACAELRGTQDSAHARAVPLCVLVGAPNAGKSTLFNALLQRTRTVTSELSGTTRDAIVERLTLGAGLEVDLADVAGLQAHVDEGVSEASIAGQMQRSARDMLRSADVVVRCTAPNEPRVELHEHSGAAAAVEAIELIEVDTKSDLIEATTHPRRADTIALSAQTGVGIETLRCEIALRIRRDRALRRARLSAILPRHDAAFAGAERAYAAVAHRAIECGPSGRLVDLELLATTLRVALDHLGEVSGAVHPDDVLGLVFSRFCIGK